eukprot:1718643-Pyramimonas_sp.AAC.1
MQRAMHVDQPCAEIAGKIAAEARRATCAKMPRQYVETEPGYLPMRASHTKREVFPTSGAIACPKQHAHVRDVAGDFRTTQALFLGEAARAIRSVEL